MEFRGLPISPQTIKCEPKTRTTDIHLTVDSVSFQGSWPGGSVTVMAEKSNSRNGFKPIAGDDVKKLAERYAGPDAKNWSAMIGSPFRHFRFTAVFNGNDFACFHGVLVGPGGTSAGGDRQYAFVGFCQTGTGAVPDENVSIISRAIQFK